MTITTSKNKISLNISVSLNDNTELDVVSSEMAYSVFYSIDPTLIKDSEVLGEEEDGIIAINVYFSKSLNDDEIEKIVDNIVVELDHDSIDSFELLDYNFFLVEK